MLSPRRIRSASAGCSSTRTSCLHVDRALVDVLLAAAELGLRRYVDGPELHAPAAHRLAFRELGLAIGLAAIAAMEPAVPARFARHLPLRDELPAFWLVPDHRRRVRGSSTPT